MKRLLTAILLLWILVGQASAQRLSPLAPEPDWKSLEAFQETITAAEFTHLLNDVYAPNNAAEGVITIHEGGASIRKNLQPGDVWELRFAPDEAQRKPAPRYWRAAKEQPAFPADKPLDGVKIALDPGHLGGPWARMEERWFKIGDSNPVTEGDMTLLVATHLVPLLEKLGAKVSLVRSTTDPVTTARPEKLRDAARTELLLLGVPDPVETYTSMEDPNRGSTVQAQSELLFYRVSEIRARAARVNQELRPDLTLCLHFDAEAWGDPLQPQLATANHLHLLVNGCYSAAELRNDDLRFDMIRRLLGGSLQEEVAASETLATEMARATGLPPYVYPGPNAKRIGENPYVWSRNLLANRLYLSPVLFFEPYVMNSEETWTRIQAGDYEGLKTVAGKERPSIFREYAAAVAEGLRQYYTAKRPAK